MIKLIKKYFKKLKEYYEINANEIIERKFNIEFEERLRKDCEKIGFDYDVIMKYIEDSKKWLN